MIFAIFFVEQPSGGFVGKCETYPGWSYIGPDLSPAAMSAAEESLRDHVSTVMRFARYVVPHTPLNSPLRVPEAISA